MCKFCVYEQGSAQNFFEVVKLNVVFTKDLALF